MAKRRTRLPPTGQLHVTERRWEMGRPFHRVHDKDFGATTCNGSGRGNARFSPIKDIAGNWIPTLYGGGTFACAVMEVPFHDVPFEAGLKTFDFGKLRRLMHSVVEPTQDLHLVDLTNVPLRKLGIPRSQLIDTDKNQYAATRKWAEAIHNRCGDDMQGMCWTSRQDDTQLALVLFGDRIEPGALEQIGVSHSLAGDPRTYAQVLDVAEVIGVMVVPGK